MKTQLIKGLCFFIALLVFAIQLKQDVGLLWVVCVLIVSLCGAILISWKTKDD